jgi:hypothetical protein
MQSCAAGYYHYRWKNTNGLLLIQLALSSVGTMVLSLAAGVKTTISNLGVRIARNEYARCNPLDPGINSSTLYVYHHYTLFSAFISAAKHLGLLLC